MTPSELAAVFAANVTALLDRRGMTQRALADRLGITEAAVSIALQGKHFPRGKRLCDCAEALGVEPWELMKPSALS